MSTHSARHDVVSADIPDIAFNTFITHLLKQLHVLLHLFHMVLVLTARFVVDDDSLVAISDDTVGTLSVTFTIVICIKDGAFGECLPLWGEPFRCLGVEEGFLKFENH